MKKEITEERDSKEHHKLRGNLKDATITYDPNFLQAEEPNS